MTDFRMHVIREIQRRRACRHLHDITFGTHGVDPILEHVTAKLVEQIVLVAARIEQVPKHPDFALERRPRWPAFLVSPVRGDTQLGMAVHVVRANLHLHRTAVGTDERRVQGLVVIVLRIRDVVVELAGQVGPHIVHDAERRITLRHGINQYAYRADVEDLAKRRVLALHLAPDAVDVLWPSGYLGMDAVVPERLPERRFDLRDEYLTLGPLLIERCGDFLVDLRLQEAEREVLELPLQLPDTKSACERRINLASLDRNRPLFLDACFLRSTQAIKLFGNAGDDQTGISDDRQQHLAERLRLLGRERLAGLPVRRQLESTQLDEAQDEFGKARDAGRVEIGGRQSPFAGSRVEVHGGLEERWHPERRKYGGDRFTLGGEGGKRLVGGGRAKQPAGRRNDICRGVSGCPGVVFDHGHRARYTGVRLSQNRYHTPDFGQIRVTRVLRRPVRFRITSSHRYRRPPEPPGLRTMAGHSKWANIQHRKGAQDKKRGKLFTKLIREITVAARMGGGDIAANPRLRIAVDKAKANSMPKDNIERAIKKGSGNLEGADFVEIRYEGYGPGGTAVLVDCMTDNRNRTVAEVRHAFSKFGGNLGADGSVSYMFRHVGSLFFAAGSDEEAIMETAIESGAADVVADDDGSIEVLTEPADFESVRDAMRAAGHEPEEAELTMRADTNTVLELQNAGSMVKMLEMLEDLDDVQHVYSNADIPDDVLAEL